MPRPLEAYNRGFREAIALVNEQSGNKIQAASFYRQAKKLYSELLKRSTKDFDEFPSMRVELFAFG